MSDATSRAKARRIESVIEERGIKLNGLGSDRSGPCPQCGGEDRFSINTDKQIFYCRQCEATGDVIDLVQLLDQCGFREAVATLNGEPSPSSLSPVERARYDFDMARTINPRRSHSYFSARGIDTTRFELLDRSVRIDPGARREKDAKPTPAVIARMTNVAGATGSVQRTFLTPGESSKDGKLPARKFPYGVAVKGLAIRLGGTAETVMVAEGLEDAMTGALAVDMAYPGWASGGWPHMRHIQFGEAVKTVIILADNDAAGQKGMRKAALAFTAQGKTVKIARPPPEVKDFNALINGASGEALAGGLATARTAIEAAENFTPPAVEEDQDNAPPQKEESPAASKFTLWIEPNALEPSVTAIETAILDAGLNIYQRYGRIVAPLQIKGKTRAGEDTVYPGINELTQNNLRETADQLIAFRRYDKRSSKWVLVDCPPHLISILMDRRERLRMPVITGIVTTPLVFPDGRILETPGYDPATGLYFEPRGAVFPPLPRNPTDKDAANAL
jgi:phage/plasmid primase-like uncharacterized protein